MGYHGIDMDEDFHIAFVQEAIDAGKKLADYMKDWNKNHYCN